MHRFIAPDYQQRDGEEIWFAGAGSIGTEIVKSQGVLVDAALLDELTAYANGQASAPKPLPEEYMDLNGDGTRLNAADLALAQQGYQTDQRVGGERIVFRYGLVCVRSNERVSRCWGECGALSANHSTVDCIDAAPCPVTAMGH